MAQFPSIIVRDYGSLLDAIRAAQQHREISNATLEHVAGLVTGHVDKLLGTSQQKRIGPLVFRLLCAALGVEFVMRPNPEAVQRMAHRWEKRNSNQVHVSQRVVSQAALDRCRPIILSEMARKGWATRRTRSGHANGHAAAR